MSYNFDEEYEVEDHHYSFDRAINPMSDLSYRPTISYKFLDIDTTSYCFNTKHFGKKESKKYLEKMKKYAQWSLEELIDNSPHEEHFTINSYPSEKERELLNQHFGDSIKGDENIPIIGHFALYTTPFEDGKQNKSPRIFFLVGEQSVLHILFFDPFHEINPIAESTKNALK